MARTTAARKVLQRLPPVTSVGRDVRRTRGFRNHRPPCDFCQLARFFQSIRFRFGTRRALSRVGRRECDGRHRLLAAGSDETNSTPGGTAAADEFPLVYGLPIRGPTRYPAPRRPSSFWRSGLGAQVLKGDRGDVGDEGDVVIAGRRPQARKPTQANSFRHPPDLLHLPISLPKTQLLVPACRNGSALPR
jgi:hypothetical protein